MSMLICMADHMDSIFSDKFRKGNVDSNNDSISVKTRIDEVDTPSSSLSHMISNFTSFYKCVECKQAYLPNNELHKFCNNCLENIECIDCGKMFYRKNYSRKHKNQTRCKVCAKNERFK